MKITKGNPISFIQILLSKKSRFVILDWLKSKWQNVIEICILIFMLILFLWFVVGCKTSSSVEEKITPIPVSRHVALYGEPAKQQKENESLTTHISNLTLSPYTRSFDSLAFSFLNDDKIYYLLSSNPKYKEYLDILLDRELKHKFYEFKTDKKNTIITIESLDEQAQIDFQEVYHQSDKNKNINQERTEIEKNINFAHIGLSAKKKENWQPTISKSMLYTLHEQCMKENYSSHYPSSLRGLMYDGYVRARTSVEAFKLLVVPRKFKTPLKMQHKFCEEKLSWLLLNVYSQILEQTDDNGKVSYKIVWFVFDPYYFHEPTRLDKAIKEIEWQSEQKVDYFIVTSEAYGYDAKNNFLLYEK